MSTTTGPNVTTAPPAPIEPVAVRDDIVRNVYPIVGPDGTVVEPVVADDTTWKGQVDHLHNRYDGEPEVGGAEPVWATVPDPDNLRTVKHRELAGLRYNRRARTGIVALALGATVLANVAQNYGAIKEFAGRAAHSLSQLFHPATEVAAVHRDITIVEVTPGAVDQHDAAYTKMHVGTANADPNNVTKVLDAYVDAAQKGTVDQIDIKGDASDDWNGVNSLGKPDTDNDKLAKRRAEEFKAALQQAAKDAGVELPPIVTGGAETVLDSFQSQQLQDVSKQFGMSYSEAYTQYNADPSKLPAPLRELFNSLIGRHRGVDVTFEAKQPDTVHSVTTHAPDTPSPVTPEQPAPMPPIDVDLWPLLGALLALAPKWNTDEEIITGFKKELIAAGHVPKQVLLKLYPEAYDPNAEDALILPAFAYLRSIQIAMREGRIPGVMRHEYEDAAGEKQTLRVMFLDHEPTPATLKAFEEELETSAHMQGGILPTRVHTVMVVPSTSTGREHGDHRRIGLGFDEQYGEDVLGVAIPLLGFVEMQMPIDPTPEELAAAMETYRHEVNGHMTSLTDQRPRLIPIGRPGERKYVTDTPWDVPDYGNLLPLNAPGTREFLATREGLSDIDGKHLPPLVMKEDDVRLAEADMTNIIGRKPTDYAGTDLLELHAEIARFVSGHSSTVPYAEARMNVRPTSGYNFATGFMPDEDSIDVYAGHVGGVAGPDGRLMWSDEPHRETARGVILEDGVEPVKEDPEALGSATTYGPIEDDPVLGPIAKQARTLPLRPDEELIKIVTGQAA